MLFLAVPGALPHALSRPRSLRSSERAKSLDRRSGRRSAVFRREEQLKFVRSFFTEWKVLNLGRHTLPSALAGCLGLLREESYNDEGCWGGIFRRPDRRFERLAIHQ